MTTNAHLMTLHSSCLFESYDIESLAHAILDTFAAEAADGHYKRTSPQVNPSARDLYIALALASHGIQPDHCVALSWFWAGRLTRLRLLLRGPLWCHLQPDFLEAAKGAGQTRDGYGLPFRGGRCPRQRQRMSGA